MTTADSQGHTDDTTPLPSNRKFGVVFAAMFVLLGSIRWGISGSPESWPWVVSGLFLLAALAAPATLTPLNRLWAKLGLLLHHIVTPVVLGIMFFAVIVPVGLLMRLFGKRPIPIRFDSDRGTYWISRTPPGPDPESMRNQF